MLAEIERIRLDLPPQRRIGGGVRRRLVAGGVLDLAYWGRPVRIGWPDLVPRGEDGNPLSAFDQAMLLYHLRQSDGTLPAGRWISYRELPGGEFYHQAYQGYTGRRLAETFGRQPELLDSRQPPAANASTVPARTPGASRPCPRVPLAACLWPGDDELPSQASVLFDANARPPPAHRRTGPARRRFDGDGCCVSGHGDPRLTQNPCPA